ncbi:hypothetical protein BJ742DRAFT_789419 [Cladochytrium replicatum]|nr:hypothetical protein BJ742DRAFT_789419 [Cladochytrium replicatum]
MSGLDPEVFVLSVIATCIAAGATLALIVVLVWRLRQLKWPKSSFFRSWTRFQKLAIWACLLSVVFYSFSMIELVLVIYISPENLGKGGTAMPGVWNKGAPKFLVSLFETASQDLLAFTVYCYFLILMERFSAFRFLMTARTFRVLYTPLFILGTLLFLLMLVSTVIININVVTLTETETNDLVLMTSSLMFLCIVFEFVLSITLCRTFFMKTTDQRTQESWNLSRRVHHETFPNSEQRKPNATSITSSQMSRSSYPPQQSAVRPNSSSTSDLPTMNQSLSRNSNSFVELRPTASTINSGSDTYSLAQVLRDPYKRRTILLFGAIVLSDAMGIVFYLLSLVPEAQKVARPIEVLGRCSVGFHIMLALIFLDSFRDILRREESVLSTASLTVPEFL